jgi:hypothetical protein
MAEDPIIEGLGLLGIRDLFGASEALSVQLLAVYIPNKDQDGNQIDRDIWVTQALERFSEVGGGASAISDMKGAWINPKTGELVLEDTNLVYTFVLPDKFVEHIAELRALFHDFGKSTNQGEVMFYFGGVTYRITAFDED